MLKGVLFLIFLQTILAIECPEGYSYYSVSQKCYKAFSTPKSYFAAENDCTNDGGNLATIENAYVNTFMGAFLTIDTDYYIGLTRLIGPNWSWLDHTTVSYTNWALGQPNPGQQCGVIMRNGLIWMALSCDNTLPYICMVSPSTPSTPSSCPTTKPATCQSSCDNGWTFFSKTNSCYKTLLLQDFSHAESTCNAMGAHLVSIHSREENQFVLGLSATGLNQSWENQVWIGMRRSAPAMNAWYNLDGTPVDYTNWGPGEPDDGGAAQNEDCVQLLSDPIPATSLDFESKWNDYTCQTVMRAFVCKKSLDS